MRTAAGVILIVLAVINLFSSLFYFGLGGAGKLTAMAAEQSQREGYDVPPESQRSAEVLKDAPRQLGTTASALLGLAVLMLVTVGTSIAAAVCLFRRRAAKFVVAAAALVVAAEVLNMVLVRFGWGNAPGLIAAIFAVLGARSISMANKPMDVAPPPAAGAPT
jgi:hypothetical protein